MLWAPTAPCDLITHKAQLLLPLSVSCSWRQELLVEAAGGRVRDLGSTLALPVTSSVAVGKSLCVSEPLVSLRKMGT